MSLIELEEVYKDYDAGHAVVHALRGVSLSIGEKEFVAISGPSGSGKSTLLNLIATIDQPTKGRVLLKGRDLATLTDNQKTDLRGSVIGFVFQRFNLLPVLTALENVMLPLELQGMARRECRARAQSMLNDVGLGSMVHHRPDHLSGGQQQRVAIARALVTGPLLVIADEPTANLDSETAYRIVDLMHALNEKHATTFIFSTHDDRLLKRVGRLEVITDGRLSEPHRRSSAEWHSAKTVEAS